MITQQHTEAEQANVVVNEVILARTQNEEEKQRNLWILFARKVLAGTHSFPFSTSGHPGPNSRKRHMTKTRQAGLA